MSFPEAPPSIQNSSINGITSAKSTVKDDDIFRSPQKQNDSHLDPPYLTDTNKSQDDSTYQVTCIPSGNGHEQSGTEAGAALQQITVGDELRTERELTSKSEEYHSDSKHEPRLESGEYQSTTGIPSEHHHPETVTPSSSALWQSVTNARAPVEKTNSRDKIALDQEKKPQSGEYQSILQVPSEPGGQEISSEWEPRAESAKYQNTSVASNDKGDVDDPDLRPPTKTWQQITIGMIGFGTEICFATETALLVPILLQLGLPNHFYSIAWFVSPILGFLLQPLIGSCSDRCSSPWGRRRPFLLGLGLLIILGLSLFLNGEYIGLRLGDTSTDHTIGIIITMIGQIIMDWSADSSDTPGRSYMLDVFNPDELEKSLSYRALLAGLGGGIGYIINGVDWMQNGLGEALGNQLHAVFLFNGTLTGLSVILTLCSVKETPLNDSKNKSKYDETVTSQSSTIQNNDICGVNQQYLYGTFMDQTQRTEGQRSRSVSERSLTISQRSRKSSQSSCSDEHCHHTSSQGGADLEWDNSFDFHHFDLGNTKTHVYRGHIQFDPKGEDVELIKVPSTKRTETLRRKSTASLKIEERDSPGSALQLLYSVGKMPRELRRLCINHFLSWLAILPILLFFTDFVGQAVYHGDPKAPVNTTDRMLYKEGVHMGSWGLCIFAFSAAISAVLYGRLLQFLSHRTMYVWAQVLFAVGTGCQAIFSHNKYVVIALCTTYGFIFTAIQTTPYSILADFHKTEKYVKSCGNHRRGLGTDIACLTCMTFLAQITVSSLLGPLMNAIGSHLVIVLFASAVAFVSAIAASVFVMYEVQEVEEEEKEEESISGDEEHSGSYEEDEHQPLLKNY